jgi:hypothetical protein
MSNVSKIGVVYLPVSTKNPFQAKLRRGGRQFYLGSYPDEESAAFAYDIGALLTRPWEERTGTQLNFPTLSKIPKEFVDNYDRPEFSGEVDAINQRFVSAYEQHWKMLEWLRNVDPTAEQRWKDREGIRQAEANASQNFDPVLVERSLSHRVAADKELAQERSVATLIANHCKRLSFEVEKLKQRIVYLEAREAEQTEELIGLRHMKAIGPIVFKRIVPGQTAAEPAPVEVPTTIPTESP